MTPGNRCEPEVMGFSNFSNVIVMAVGNLAESVIYEHVTSHLPFFFTAAAIAPAFIITLTLVHEPVRKED